MSYGIILTASELDVLALLVHTGIRHEGKRLEGSVVSERVKAVVAKIALARQQPMLALA